MKTMLTICLLSAAGAAYFADNRNLIWLTKKFVSNTSKPSYSPVPKFFVPGVLNPPRIYLPVVLQIFRIWNSAAAEGYFVWQDVLVYNCDPNCASKIIKCLRMGAIRLFLPESFFCAEVTVSDGFRNQLT